MRIAVMDVLCQLMPHSGLFVFVCLWSTGESVDQ